MRAGRSACVRILSLISAFVVAGATVAGPPTAVAAAPRPAAAQAATTQPARTPPTNPQPAKTQPATTPPAKAQPVRGATAAACGGELAFGEIAVCPSITGERRDVFTITTTKRNDRLFTMLTRGSGDFAGATVTGSGDAPICFLTVDAGTCDLRAARTYTITVSLNHGGSGDYTLSVQSMRTPSGCTTLSNAFFSFASTGEPGDLPAGSSGDCYRFNQPVGSVVRLWSPMSGGDVQGQILDARYEPVCEVRYAQFCTLGTAGPYHLTLREAYGNPTPYTLRMSRISGAAGCATLRLTPFGDPGGNTGTGSLGGENTIGCHKLRMPSAGTVGVRISPSQLIYWYLYDDAGRVVCESHNTRSCHLPAAGDYTVITLNQHWDPVAYRIAAPALFRNGGCAAGTGLSWAPDALVVHQTSAVQTNCQPFTGEAGDRVIAYRAPTSYNDLAGWLVDGSGEPICTDHGDEDGCVLPATGTYRFLSYLSDWDAGSSDETYRLQVRRLSQPVGCPVVRPGAYNAEPAGAMGPIRCRILDIATPGRYVARAYDAENNETNAAVYDGTGHRVCDGNGYCEIPAAGRYTMVLNGGVISSVIDNDYSYVTTLLPYQPAQCPTVSDAGPRDAPYRGGFTAPGQYVCLQLPSPAGARVVELLPTDARDSANPSGYVRDATGAYVCDTSWGLRHGSCELTGTAPFYAIFNADGDAPGPFALQFARMDGPPACPVLPRGAEGATVTTGADGFAVCFSIPADQHASQETFTWDRTAGSGTAMISVFDSTGGRYCGPSLRYADRTVTCPLPDGPVTVILETGSTDATYKVTHRDGTTP